jgi:hypothetical protein
MASIHSAPELKLSSGKPSVRLQRFFAGGAKVGKGGAFVIVGQAGQADLVGMLTVEVVGWVQPEPNLPDLQAQLALGLAPDAPKVAADILATPPGLLALYVEVEIKMPKGHQSEVQHVREEVIRSRGGIYLVVRSVRALVEGLVAERDRVLGLVGYRSDNQPSKVQMSITP